MFFFDNFFDSYKVKVVLLGCGSVSISCVMFLVRMGYINFIIFEKYDYIGGLRCIYYL